MGVSQPLPKALNNLALSTGSDDEKQSVFLSELQKWQIKAEMQ